MLSPEAVFREALQSGRQTASGSRYIGRRSSLTDLLGASPYGGFSHDEEHMFIRMIGYAIGYFQQADELWALDGRDAACQ